jgi:hypothetical protein
LQSKALLQKDLIASEEQRLQVSKYFIDLQLKSSQDAEAAEAAKFEQGQRLLSCVSTPTHRVDCSCSLYFRCENDILELEIELQSRDDAIEALNRKGTNASRDSEDMKSEFIATRALVEQLTGTDTPLVAT